MTVVFILVFVAILMAGGFLVAFIWAVKSGQYEDTYTPSVRILFDDVSTKKEGKTEMGEGKEETGKKSRGEQLQMTKPAVAGSGLRVISETQNPKTI